MQPVEQYYFRRAEMFALADRLRGDYSDAAPFPHIVIDDFLPAGVLEPVLTEFPETTEADWQRYDTESEMKLALADTERLGPATRHLLAEFNGQVFIEFLERLTGILGLLPDPHYYGGGLHQIRTGGFLKLHADFNRHRRLNVDRRLNGLLYLNDDWSEEWGGHLELWNTTMSACEQRILPVFNRFVLFTTTDDANHGHPDPLRCPPDRTRRSMALYYYTNGRPEHEVTAGHTTMFRPRPGESLKPSLTQTVRSTLEPWVPPAVFALRDRFRRP